MTPDHERGRVPVGAARTDRSSHLEQLEKLDIAIKSWRIGAYALVVAGIVAFLIGLSSTVVEGAEGYMISGTIAMVFGFALLPALAVARVWHGRQLLDWAEVDA